MAEVTLIAGFAALLRGRLRDLVHDVAPPGRVTLREDPCRERALGSGRAPRTPNGTATR